MIHTGDSIDDIDKIADFIQREAPHYTDRELVKEYIKLHFQYKTAFVMKDGDDVIAICRWNLNGDTADILDLYIDKKYRGKRIIQQMLERGKWLFPEVKYISFVREKKYPSKDRSFIEIDKILKRS